MQNNSKRIEKCQICSNDKFESILFLGFVPPVNDMKEIGTNYEQETMFPLELLVCEKCKLAQISYEVDQAILFPPSYPYRSGTTKILIENFKNLSENVDKIKPLTKDTFVIDIGSNDGTLLSNFHNLGCKTLGIEPTDKADLAIEKGIDSLKKFFSKETAEGVVKSHGKADVITAANVFAHIKDIDDVVVGIKELLDENGMFVSESHYLLDLIKTLQYDTVYHEHLRYYSLSVLNYLFSKHNMEIFNVERIPTHGGSIRVYTSKKGLYEISNSVQELLEEERSYRLDNIDGYKKFANNVMMSKLELMSMLKDIKKNGEKVYAIGAPSRASTLVSYVGLDEQTIDCVLEIKGSHKIGKYMPGTKIPVLDESILFNDQPEYALLLSWHISEELIFNLKRKGFKGKFIVPLPTPKIVE